MKTHILILLMAALFVAEATRAQELPPVESLSDGKLKYVELTGSPYERGKMHGELFRADILRLIDDIKKDINRNTGRDADSVLALFLEEQNFLAAIQKYTPDLLEEVRGIADGAQIDFETIYWLQLMDEIGNYTMYVERNQQCTSFGVDPTPNHPAMTGQNLDMPPFLHKYLTLIKVDDPIRGKAFVVTYPGIIGGGPGLNEHAVSVNVNCLWYYLKSEMSGLPYSYIVRGALNMDTYQEAYQFMTTVKHSTGHNYVIGGKERVADLECSPNNVVEYRPFEGAFFTYHTNYPLVNSELSVGAARHAKKNGIPIDSMMNSFHSHCQRFPSLSKRFNEQTTEISLTDIQEVFKSKDHEGYDVICKESTNASVIFTLSESPSMLIAPGQPDETEYLEFNF